MKNRRIIYFFLSRLHKDKGVREAIQVAKKTGRKLRIAGFIADQAYFEKEVQPYLDNEQIIYEGHVTPEFKKELLSNAYALLHMINYEEAFGIGVVEAMASGTPVIAMNRVQCLSLSGMERLDFLLIVLRKLPKLCKNLAPYPAKKMQGKRRKTFFG